ncbi:hypothetical protein QFC20_004376 [Naganishia adeliensis]|uniref:Uncharacterized protein n=1 Tax=Naganishia adeliensis TaxID=92952 RepID=A0ACC2W1U2_9TREE|nr:hypothetical protein QFC20_004376 [Naganishia adeliensis]
MQVNKLSQGIQDFTSKIFSNDPVEYNSAINLYLEPQAHYVSALVKTHGASRIKKLVALEKLFVRKRQLRRDLKKSGKGGIEGWDESAQTLTLPTLTTYSLPFSLPLINLLFTLPTTLVLHLNGNEDGEADEEDAALYSDDEGEADDAPNGELKLDGERERRLVVTKWEEKSVLDTLLSKSRLISDLYTTFILPFISYTLLVLSGCLYFYNTHHLNNGLFKYALDAAAEVFHALEGELARLMGGDRQQMASAAASTVNAYLQSGKRATQQLASSVTETTTTTEPDNHPTPSGNSPPSLYKSSSPKPPSFRPSSAQQPTTSSSFTHVQGQHVPQTQEKSIVSSGTSYAAVVGADNDDHHLAAPLAAVGEDGSPSYTEVAVE